MGEWDCYHNLSKNIHTTIDRPIQVINLIHIFSLIFFVGLRQRHPGASEAHWNTVHQYALSAAQRDPVPRDIFKVSGRRSIRRLGTFSKVLPFILD